MFFFTQSLHSCAVRSRTTCWALSLIVAMFSLLSMLKEKHSPPLYPALCSLPVWVVVCCRVTCAGWFPWLVCCADGEKARFTLPPSPRGCESHPPGALSPRCTDLPPAARRLGSRRTRTRPPDRCHWWG